MARKNDTGDRILAAATMLFWKQGYFAVSTEDICRAAGISKGSLYHYHENKEALLNASLETVWNGNIAEIRKIHASAKPIEERLRTYFGWAAKSQKRLQKTLGFVPGTFDMALGVAVPPSTIAAMNAHIETVNALLAEALVEYLGLSAVDRHHARTLAEVLGYMLTGATTRARLRNDCRPLEGLDEVALAIVRSYPMGRPVETNLDPS